MEKENIAANYITEEIIEKERTQHGYREFLEGIKNHFQSALAKERPLFTTDVEGLFDVFLEKLPPEHRQRYTCNTCRRFVNNFGRLVTITEEGELESVMWGEVPAFFEPSVQAMKEKILSANVEGVFVSDKAALGRPATGIWIHMSVELPEKMVSKSRLQTPYQIRSEKAEDFKTLVNAVGEYSLEAVEQATALLKTEALYRSEKCLGVAEWLERLHRRLIDTKNKKKQNNIIWMAVATAPAGYCHIRSSMIGTLLDDIIAGLPFESVSRRFAEKMHPLQYQRPQSAPTAGNIKRAEEIVEKLGIQNSLLRRFARLEELETIWSPKGQVLSEKKKGIFSELVPREDKKSIKMEIPAVTMTWKKFSETVLPLAEKIEFLVKKGKDNFCALLTASDKEAPPILQWDQEENRNPFSIYVYIGGSYAKNWNLSTGYCKVTGICYRPSMWHENLVHQGKGVIFLLEGAKDTTYKGSGSAIFPETLKAELHEIRATIEAYSKQTDLEGYEESSACGILLQGGANQYWDATFRVTTRAGKAVYRLDRWD